MGSQQIIRPAKNQTPEERDRADLFAALSSALALIERLIPLLAEPSGRGPATGTIGRGKPDGSEPWNSEVADAFWRLWFGLRKLAKSMRESAGLSVQDFPSTYRGTVRAVDAIRNAATAVTPEVLAESLGAVARWVSAARRIRDIDEEDAWTPVPRAPGAEPPACPYCRTLSLRMSKAREVVRCFFPGCVDIDGNPTQARMEQGRLGSGGMLVFGDGTVVAYREDHEPEN